MRYIYSRDDVMAVALAETEESFTLDFQANVNPWNPPEVRPERADQLEMRTDIAQFASAFGGVVLIGVNDKPKRADVKIARHTAPINDGTALTAWTTTGAFR